MANPTVTDPTSTDAPNTAPLIEGEQAPVKRSAAARRAAGERVTVPEEGGHPSERVSTTVLPSSGVAAIDDEGPISESELIAFRAFKASRASEIAMAIAEAPVAIGTDLNPYTLVHARGCPEPSRTETYEVLDPSNHEWTVHRCIECGAHLPIPH